MKKENYFNFVIVALFVISVSVLFLIENGDVVNTSSEYVSFGTVVIDAGHGGEDGGAVGLEGILEKEINLSVSQKLENVLNLCGINTEMTRRSDMSLSLDGEGTVRGRKVADTRKRVEQIARIPNATLISIHQNSFPQENCSGAQVFYSRNNTYSKILAQEVQKTLKIGVNKDNRRTEKESEKTIYILENVNCPAILVECGFLTNEKEAKLLKEDAYQTKLAISILAGVLNYQKEK